MQIHWHKLHGRELKTFESYSTLFETLWENRFIGVCVFSAYLLIFTCGFKG